MEGPPDLSLAPVFVALRALVVALSTWFVNVAVRLPRYLLFGVKRSRVASVSLDGPDRKSVV